MNTKNALRVVSLVVVLGLTGMRSGPPSARHLNDLTEPGNLTAAQVTIPEITKATLEKKDLILEGEGLAAGATVLLNGTRTLKARNDDATPGTKLIVKKGRNSLPVDEVVSLQVKNPDQQVSVAIGFFTGMTLTHHNTQDGGGVLLHVGQIALLSFDDPDITWNIFFSAGHDSIIEFISSRVPLLPRAQELFLAKQPGNAQFQMVGAPRSAPPFGWLVNVTVQ